MQKRNGLLTVFEKILRVIGYVYKAMKTKMGGLSDVGSSQLIDPMICFWHWLSIYILFNDHKNLILWKIVFTEVYCTFSRILDAIVY